MAAEPTFDQTLTADGVTVRLHRVGGKLTVEVADPTGAVRELEVVDGYFKEPVTTVTGLGFRARSQNLVAPMFKALDTMNQATVGALREGLGAPADYAPAQSALYRAVSAAGYTELWADVITETRETCEHRGLAGHSTLTVPLLAATFRELIGHHDYTAEHYDLMTMPWRIIVGPIHPDDADVARELVDEAVLLNQCVSVNMFANFPLPLGIELIRNLSSAHPSHPWPASYVSAREHARNRLEELGRVRALQQVSILASRALDPAALAQLETDERERTYEIVRDVAQALLLRDLVGTDTEFTVADYDVLTSAWRTQIAPLHAKDVGPFQTGA